MRHLIYLTILLLSSTPSFSDDGSSGSSSTSFSTGDTAQIAGLLGGLAGGKAAGQAGNAVALISGISKLNTDLKNIPAVATDITASANGINTALRGKIDPAFTKLTAELSSASLASAAEATALQAAFNAYMVSKEACVKSAETSVMMCSEGTSPGAIKVKALMELATPALGLISSAQKACSSTAQVTDFLSKGLVVAKGACVAAKTMCDTSCGTANSQLMALKAKIVPFMNKTGTEISAKMAACPSPTCEYILEMANEGLAEFMAVVPTTLQAEQVPATVGSTGYLVARCQSNFKDIAMFGVNIASLVVAKKSADECATKLAGTAGAKVSTLQFCENPANATSDFCKCQKDNTQKGCPGYIATSDAAKDPSVDVKNTGKGNQFASGTVNSGPSSAINSAGNGSSESAASAQAPLDSANGSLYGSTMGGSGSNSFGSASSATDASGSDKNPEKKKWGFGAFMSSFGGGSGSGGGSNSAKSGSSLGQKNMDAIKRQIASEQLRAEVSESSGKSNWEKVRERYNSNTATLLNGK